MKLYRVDIIVEQTTVKEKETIGLQIYPGLMKHSSILETLFGES